MLGSRLNIKIISYFIFSIVRLYFPKKCGIFCLDEIDGANFFGVFFSLSLSVVRFSRCSQLQEWGSFFCGKINYETFASDSFGVVLGGHDGGDVVEVDIQVFELAVESLEKVIINGDDERFFVFQSKIKLYYKLISVRW